MEKENLFFGEYTLDPKIKAKPCWIHIKNRWIALSKTPDSPFFVFLPLNLKNLSSGSAETNNQNSILIETNDECGNALLFLSSTNRFEAISLFKTIKNQSEWMNSMLTEGSLRQGVYFEYEEKNFLMKKIHKFTFNENGFSYSKGSKINHTDLNNLVAVIPLNDGNHFIVRRKEENDAIKEDKYGPVPYKLVKDVVQYFSIKAIQDRKVLATQEIARPQRTFDFL